LPLCATQLDFIACFSVSAPKVVFPLQLFGPCLVFFYVLQIPLECASVNLCLAPFLPACLELSLISSSFARGSALRLRVLLLERACPRPLFGSFVPLACASFPLLDFPAVRFGLIASGAHPGSLLLSVLVILQFCPGSESQECSSSP
jgi:hypothetical protein